MSAPLSRVVLIDSGIDAGHPALRGRGRIAAARTIDKSGVCCDEPRQRDPLGHGTAVAATILALAPHAELVPIRIFDGEGTCSAAVLLAALDQAAAAAAAFVNVSLGLREPGAEPLLLPTVAALRAAGCRVIAPAGLHGLPCLPGALPGVDAVVADPNVPRARPRQELHGGRTIWFASPEPPPGLPGLPPRYVRGDSIAVANVTGCLLLQAASQA